MSTQSILEAFANLLGYYQLQAEEYYSTYGYDFYIPSMQEVASELGDADQVFIDVCSAQIATLITDEFDTDEVAFFVIYDFASIIGGLGVLQQRRIMDAVLDDLEVKGYRITESTDPITAVLITWSIAKYRMFKKVPRQTPPL